MHHRVAGVGQGVAGAQGGRGRGGVEHIGLNKFRPVHACGVDHFDTQCLAGIQGKACQREVGRSNRGGRGVPVDAICADVHNFASAQIGGEHPTHGLRCDPGVEVGTAAARVVAQTHTLRRGAAAERRKTTGVQGEAGGLLAAGVARHIGAGGADVDDPFAQGGDVIHGQGHPFGSTRPSEHLAHRVAGTAEQHHGAAGQLGVDGHHARCLGGFQNIGAIGHPRSQGDDRGCSGHGVQHIGPTQHRAIHTAGVVHLHLHRVIAHQRDTAQAVDVGPDGGGGQFPIGAPIHRDVNGFTCVQRGTQRTPHRL